MQRKKTVKTTTGMIEGRVEKQEHATVKCISGNMRPVRWNWTG